MKRLLISVAVLLFATMLFIHDDSKENTENLAKEDVISSVEAKQQDS